MFEITSLLAYDSSGPPNPLSWNSEISFIKQSVVLGTLVLVIYDYLCTFDQEVKHIWRFPPSFGIYLFVLNRYLPFISLTLNYLGYEIYLSTAGCLHLYTASTWLNLSGILVAQAILYLRTIALWERNRWVSWSLAVLYIFILVPSIFLTKIYTESLSFDGSHPDGPKGCRVAHANPIIFLDYVLLLFSETVVVILTVITAYRHLRHSNSWWVRELYASGFLFYLYLLAFTILNMIFSLLAPASLKATFNPIQVALHSILCNRVVFVILGQKTYHTDSSDSDSGGLRTDDVIISSTPDSYVMGEWPYVSH